MFLIYFYQKNMTKITFFILCLFSNIQIYSQTTNIPDSNFEQALINDGIDSDGTINGVVLTSDIESLTFLNVRNENISDLTGIEDFVALTSLNVGQNNLTTLNLSNNLSLESLFCFTNSLTSLDISNHPNLTLVNCSENQLSSIDISQNLSLTSFFCALNQLTSLDVSANNLLERLWCYENDLTNLDVRNGANGLLAGTTTDPSNTYSNFRAELNPALTCIYVDNASDANNLVNDYQDWQIDNASTFVENEAECNVLSLSSFKSIYFKVYPNPFTNELKINTSNTIKNKKLFDAYGKLISENFEINFQDLTSGIYFLELKDELGNVSTKKIIKK